MKHVPSICSAIALATLASGCAHQIRPEAARTPAPVAVEPQPPAGAAKGLSLPSPDGDGHYATINSGIGDQEAVWHLRAALNVAALSCRDQSIVGHYNQMLRSHKAAFAAAYAGEASRLHGAALDQHQTRLYNFFAQPPAKIGFCHAAESEAAQAASAPATNFPAYAAKAVDRLEAPVIAFYAAYDRYRRELAAWQAGDRRPAVMIAAASPAPAKHVAKTKEIKDASDSNVAKETKVASDSWRIQLGAFSGQSAAETAWKKARAQMPSLADYEPRYEPVPGRPSLVRLQVGVSDDRDRAEKLCATATANGMNCVPVSG